MSRLTDVGRRVARRLFGRPTAPSPADLPPPVHPARPAPTAAPPAPVADSSCTLADQATLTAAIHGPGSPRLIVHWATWCDGCIEEIPLLLTLHERIGDAVSFVGISWDRFQGGESDAQSLDTVRQVQHAHGIGWPTLIVDIAPEDLFEALSMECHTIPQLWCVDATGTVVHRVEGLASADDAKAIEAALSQD